MRLADTSIEVAAPREVVFDLFTASDGLEQWMATVAQVDLRRGGAWRWVHDNGDVCSGEYLLIDRPRRLSFTYGWESGRFADIEPGSTRVDVEFEPNGNGTRVVLRHGGLAGAAVDQHRTGWEHFLGRLAAVATAPTGPDAAPRPHTDRRTTDAEDG